MPAEAEPAPAPEQPATQETKSVSVPDQDSLVAPQAEAPVFKLQILASATKLRRTDPQLKGQKQADCFQEGGLYKYTLGSSENYQEIYQLRKAQLARFPQSFIIAFKGGVKMDVRQAIREYRSRKVKR
jgi:N-acetylmuramoyl-L-alanine amidase